VRALRRLLRNLFRLREHVRSRDLADEIRMVLPQVCLRVLPELVVVLAPDYLATHARYLLHRFIVRPNGTPAPIPGTRRLDERFAKYAAATLAPTPPRGAAIVMATFALIAEHPPELCPTSNAQTRQILKQGAGELAQLAEQLGIEIDTLRIFGPDHVILAVIEAEEIDSVRTFALQSGLMQWNTVKIHATYSIEEAVAMVEQVEAIF
jgi:hypothetical protein